MNLYQKFLATVTQQPESVATVRADDNAERTFAQLHALSSGLARALGDQRGKHVGLLGPNVPEFIAAYFGIVGAGATAVPFNAMLTPAELLPQLLHSEVTALVVIPPLDQLLPALQDQYPDLPVYLLHEIIPAEDPLEPAPFGDHHTADDVALILYTSGTTGDPKGVMLSHHNIIANYDDYREAFGLRGTDTFIVVLPFFHTFAFTVKLVPCACLGTRLIVCSSFKPRQIIKLFQNNKDIVFTAVPPMFRALALVAPEEIDISDNIRAFVSGGGPMPPQVQQLFEQRFACELYEGYGLTEAAPVVCSNRPGLTNKKGTIGPPLPHVEVMVRDDNGHPLPAGEVGELVVRGPNVMCGYYRNPSSTTAVLSEDGWLYTGDLASLDEDNYVTIRGRKKELIVSAGENIHPREVEEVLQLHPAVFEAAVVGVEDPVKTEVPKAFVSPAPGATADSIDLKDLKEFCRKHLATHKVPVTWEVLSEFPKTATGKIAKKQLEATATR